MVKDKLSPTYIFCFDFDYPIRHFEDNHFNCVDHKKVYRRFHVAIFVYVVFIVEIVNALIFNYCIFVFSPL